MNKEAEQIKNRISTIFTALRNFDRVKIVNSRLNIDAVINIEDNRLWLCGHSPDELAVALIDLETDINWVT